MNIVLTGSNGYIAKSIYNSLKNKHNFIFLNRNNVNLLDKEDIFIKLCNQKIDIIIHTAVEGGRRTSEDKIDIVYKNLLMFENLLHFRNHTKFILNIASGAEFDRSKPIHLANEEDIFLHTPKDYYGFSKNLISKRIYQINENVINFRIFGIFDENESPDRFIKNNIIRLKNNLSPEIHADKFMDFIYMQDFISILEYYINNNNFKYKDINLCYENKYKLTDIAKIIFNGLSSAPKQIAFDYTGNNQKLKDLGINLVGLEEGIKKVISIL